MTDRPATVHSVDPETLEALARRCEAGECGETIEREILPLLGARDESWDNGKIWMITLQDVVPSKIICDVGSLCTSLDAVASLTEAMLPGWRVWEIVEQQRDGIWSWRCTLHVDNGADASCHQATTEPLARLAALLRALAAEIRGRS